MSHASRSMMLMHINDTHSYFDSSAIALTLPLFNDKPIYVQCGGFARLSWAIKYRRDALALANIPNLLLHAGDSFQGSLYFSLFKGEANATLLNTLDIDAMALGNHELDMGNDLVGRFLRRVNFPMLAGNWDLSHELTSKEWPLKNASNLFDYEVTTDSAKFQIKEYEGYSIALFGITLEDMFAVANPDLDTPFESVNRVIENTIKIIQAKGIKNIILLSHLGYERDCDVAANFPDLDVIVGGHSHTFQGDFSKLGLGKKDQYAQKIGETYVVQAGCHALMLGQLMLHFSDSGKLELAEGQNQLLLGDRFSWDAQGEQGLSTLDHQSAVSFLAQQDNVLFCQEDKAIKTLLAERYHPAIVQWEKEVLAEVMTPLRHVRVPDKKGGSQVAPLVAASFLWQARELSHSVDFAIHNAGGVRSSLNAGPLTHADVAGRILPFSMTLGIYAVKGHSIRAALEGAINNAIDNGVQGTGTGSFPYVAGLRFLYRCEQPMGQRITKLDIETSTGWSPLDDKKTYRGISSSYTVLGKEGYGALLEREDEVTPVMVSMSDAFAAYVRTFPQLWPLKETLESMDCSC